jgi:PKD repeat protein
MILKYTLAFVLLFSVWALDAQEVFYCGQTEQTEAIFNRFPQLRHDAEALERQLKDEEEALKNARSGGEREEVLYIPVVFHVIHNGGPENISDEQVESCIDVLNRDFRRLNADVSQVHPDFADIAADIRIEFRLAKRDPDGNCTKGIVRVQSPLTEEGGNNMKALSYWPRNRYMNVWTCAYAGGAAGYTMLPSTVNNPFMASVDGIVLLHDYTGNIGTSNNFRSRTITHEVGHWLNLRHTWGAGNTPGQQSNCDQDDGVDDTPNTIGWQSCNTLAESCGTLDNVQNYMDYSYCFRMFTNGQKDRMRAAALSSVAQRNQLIAASTHTATGIFEEALLCSADFTASETVACVGEPIQLFDDSFHGVTSWSWQIGDSQTISGDDPEVHRNPEVVFDAPGLYTIALTVSNGEDELTTTRNNFIRVLPAGEFDSPFTEGFENGLNEEHWFIENQLGNVTWELTGLASFEGERCVRLRNINNSTAGSTDALISSTIDLSGATHAEINYRWSYANRVVETDDRLRVSISRDCGKTWVLRKMHRGLNDLPTVPPQNAVFTPTSQDQWAFNAVSVNNSDFLIENFRAKFEFEGRGGNNLYLDNINVIAFGQDGTSVYDIGANRTFRMFPNPMDATTTLAYELEAEHPVRITLHDMLGREVRVLFEGRQPGGEHQTIIERQGLASGMYVVRVQVANTNTAMRLIIK